MKNALYGFLAGVLVCCLIVLVYWLFVGSAIQGRYLDDLRRVGSELANAQENLDRITKQRDEVIGRLTGAVIEIGQYRKALEGSQAELGKLRSILGRGQDAVDSSLHGIDRIRKIIEGLPTVGSL